MKMCAQLYKSDEVFTSQHHSETYLWNQFQYFLN